LSCPNVLRSAFGMLLFLARPFQYLTLSACERNYGPIIPVNCFFIEVQLILIKIVRYMYKRNLYGRAMNNIGLVLSIIFNIVSAVSVFLGLYVLSANPKTTVNRLFLTLSLCLSVWALGFAIAISAPFYTTCELWRRIAAFGWGTFFSVMLHYFLCLTGHDRLLKKWWIYLVLYVPSALTVAAFTFIPDINPQQYFLVNTPNGWVNFSKNTAWDWFYALYYTGFSLAGFILVWRWGKKFPDGNASRQARPILISIPITVVLGSVTDILGNSVFHAAIPQIGPIIMLLPVAAMYYSIRRYGLMNAKLQHENQVILDEQNNDRLFNYISFACVAGGMLNILAQYVLSADADISTTLIFSSALFLLAVLFQVVRRLKVKRRVKDLLNTALVVLVIPIVTLRFIGIASLTIWAFPFIFVVVSLIFSKRFIPIAVAISIICTQIMVWMLKPHTVVLIDAPHHIARIGIYLIAIWLGLYVNKVFVKKIDENNAQIDAQKLIADISTDYVAVNGNNFDEKTDEMLRKLGGFFNADRAFMYLFDEKRASLSCKHHWSSEEDGTDGGAMEDIIAADNPYFTGMIKSDSPVHIPDVERMPVEALAEKERLGAEQIKSRIGVPIASKGAVVGFLGLDSIKTKRIWNDGQFHMLKIVTNILADAMAKVQQEKEINEMAYYDPLTKLPNRLLFKDRVNQAILQANRTNKTAAIMFVDLDAFKSINDTVGHGGGDSLLKKIAEILQKALRKSDTVCRYGGDEFMILITNIAAVKDIKALVEKVMGVFKKPFIINGQEFFITASAGVAVYPADGDDADKLITNADIAMYKAKEKGKNGYVMCSSDMKDEVIHRMRLTNNLYRALERDEFVLHYQPQICLHTRKIIGLEALIRWEHPEMGRISPAAFIPLAEQTGLINPIGNWVLRTACRQNKAWQDMGLPKLRMAVNVSASQFRNPFLVQHVKDNLRESGLDPAYLELEITESAANNEADYIIGVLNNLKDLGVSISIDDFGTEYSSLARLKMLPIDRIKMDMQFVHGIAGDDKDKAITKVIINLAQNLGLKVVAEGVETEQQLEFLSQRMCDEVQGYYYYRPMPARDTEAVLRESMEEESLSDMAP
jgi:diguanylate cyclase (GGDEF)-like protein